MSTLEFCTAETQAATSEWRVATDTPLPTPVMNASGERTLDYDALYAYVTETFPKTIAHLAE